MKYNYQLIGVRGNGHAWETKGTVDAEPGAFLKVPALALAQSMQQLLDNDATFERPDLPCGGPYQITRMVVEVQKS